MSSTSSSLEHSNPEKPLPPPHSKRTSAPHRRQDSSELDVFEAARYFSGDAAIYRNYSHLTHYKTIKEDKHTWRSSGRRISLDVPIKNLLADHHLHHAHHQNSHQTIQTQILKDKNKNQKQPSSPGGRLASFLNSLFNQAALKKKKHSKSSKENGGSSTQEEESPGGFGRRKRRSSISHFRSASAADCSSINLSKPAAVCYSSSSTSGFRTPPPPCSTNATPTKTHSNGSLRSPRSDQKQSGSFSKHSNNASLEHINPNPTSCCKRNRGFSRLNNGDKCQKNLGGGFLEKDGIWVDDYRSWEKDFGKFGIEDDGVESDSSSDLFELENYDLGFYSSSSGLPVYETTRMDSIKRGGGTPISSAAI